MPEVERLTVPVCDGDNVAELHPEAEFDLHGEEVYVTDTDAVVENVVELDAEIVHGITVKEIVEELETLGERDCDKLPEKEAVYDDVMDDVVESVLETLPLVVVDSETVAVFETEGDALKLALDALAVTLEEMTMEADGVVVFDTVIDDDIVAVTVVEIDRHAEIDSVGQLLAEVVDDTVGVADVEDDNDAMDAVGDEDPDTVAVNETETVELNDDVALNDGDRVAVIDTDEVLHAVAETELQIDAENDAVIVGELEGERDTEKEEVNVGELE